MRFSILESEAKGPIELPIMHGTTPESAKSILDSGFSLQHYGRTSRKTGVMRHYEVEPRAVYALVVGPKMEDPSPPGHPYKTGSEGTWIFGKVTLKNPLRLPLHYDDGTPWAEALSKRYGGKTKGSLTAALIRDGYDGLILMIHNLPMSVVVFDPDAIEIDRKKSMGKKTTTESHNPPGESAVSFDFDGVLHLDMDPESPYDPRDIMTSDLEPNEPMLTLLRKEAKDHRIYIVTKRGPGCMHPVYDFVRRHKLPVYRVIGTDMRDKGSFLKRIGAIRHYDDNPGIRREAPGIETILVKHGRPINEAVNKRAWLAKSLWIGPNGQVLNTEYMAHGEAPLYRPDLFGIGKKPKQPIQATTFAQIMEAEERAINAGWVRTVLKGRTLHAHGMSDEVVRRALNLYLPRLGAIDGLRVDVGTRLGHLSTRDLVGAEEIESYLSSGPSPLDMPRKMDEGAKHPRVPSIPDIDADATEEEQQAYWKAIDDELATIKKIAAEYSGYAAVKLTRGKFTVIIHASTKKAGQYQASRIITSNGEPWGDTQYPSMRAALEAELRDGYQIIDARPAGSAQ